MNSQDATPSIQEAIKHPILITTIDTQLAELRCIAHLQTEIDAERFDGRDPNDPSWR